MMEALREGTVSSRWEAKWAANDESNCCGLVFGVMRDGPWQRMKNALESV